MESQAEYQLLKLKVASEIVRSGQTAVAFSRAFYLEEILINRIEKELKDLCQAKETLQKELNTFMDELEQERGAEDSSLAPHNESQSLSRQSIYQKCHNLLDSVEGKHDLIEEFRERIIKAEARKQAKSCLLEKLSSHDLMSRFECMSVEEFREIQVPEFSCFINDSDFGSLERLNEDWCLLKEELQKEVNEASTEIHSIRQEIFERSFCASSYESIMGLVLKTQTTGSHRRKSGSLVRRFSTLLRRKQSEMSISSGSNNST